MTSTPEEREWIARKLNPDGRTDCQACGNDQCGDCARPGGARLAANGGEHPTCCCGRRFRTG